MREIETSSGAQFIRADLHIHSFGQDGSYDVTDTEMIPEKIVDEAIKNNLGIISITDHNEINNCQKAIQYSENNSIFVIPGIEVSTIQGHLLAYFDNFQNLKKFHSQLKISDDKLRCDFGIKQCLDLISDLNGIGILAHIELSSGFEQTIGRFNQVMEDIFTHKILYALEISNKNSNSFYTDEDDNEEHKKLIRLRRNKLSLLSHSILPKVMFSDAHKIVSFGKNASDSFKLTRIKLEEKSFQALRIALINYESRIRIEEFIPEKIPFFYGMTIDGGLLDKQDIKFSKNLTCIIGGRGTGKSTLLESLRVSSGNETESSLLDCEVWPDEINLQYIDETGYVSEFKKYKESQLENVTDASFGLEKAKIEIYGQGDTASTLHNSENEPTQLLKFLDNFINIKVLQKEDIEICELLNANRVKLEKFRTELISELEYKKNLKDLDNKKAVLEREKVGELVSYLSALQTEHGLRDRMIEGLNNLISNYKASLENAKVFESFSNIEDKSIIIGKIEYSQIKDIIREFSLIIQQKNNEITKLLDEKINILRKILTDWKNRETEIHNRIEIKKQELIKQGIPVDIYKINKLTEDIEKYNEKIEKCKQYRIQLQSAENERRELIEKRISLKREIFKDRIIYANQINNNLKNSVDGLFVDIKFYEGCLSQDFEDYLKKTMNWHTIQVNKAKHIARKMSPLQFSFFIKNNNIKSFADIVNKERIFFSENEIKQIFNILSLDKNYEEFESISFEDLPSLQITKKVKGSNGDMVYITKPITQLSLGQQQSILLAILLQSKSNDPLLIDQPEDNLDSEFIYKTIVNNLRQIKEKRQVIIVTHNANIAVLGDAELVIPLKSTNTRTYLQNPGSIDCDNIRESCCEILEGGKQAFIDRRKIYNI